MTLYGVGKPMQSVSACGGIEDKGQSDTPCSALCVHRRSVSNSGHDVDELPQVQVVRRGSRVDGNAERYGSANLHRGSNAHITIW